MRLARSPRPLVPLEPREPRCGMRSWPKVCGDSVRYIAHAAGSPYPAVMIASLMKQLRDLQEFKVKRPDGAAKLVHPTATSVAAKIGQLPNLTHDDTIQLMDAAEKSLVRSVNEQEAKS